MKRLFLLAAVVLAAGCAPKGPSPQFVAEVAKAEALMRQGCYTCLKEALALFQKHAAGQVPIPGAREGQLNAALLVSIRERELGMPSDDALAEARRLLLPERQAIFDAAQLIRGDLTGLDPEQRSLRTGANNRPLEPDNPLRRALDSAPDADVTAKYVALAIDCEQPKLSESLDMRALGSVYSEVPLMRFKVATCGRPAAPLAGALREADPRWTDTLYWEARRELVSSLGRAIDFPKVLSLYSEGRRAFPTSTMLTMAWANASLTAEDFEGALSGFDDVIKAYPEHRDALNGRMQALSYLLRHPDGVAAATRLLDLGTWHIGDAYYWRAWNRYNLKEFETAWADVENAAKGLSNARVYMLAGLIAYARKDLPTAVERFDRAWDLDGTACDARWMSGLVSIDMNELAVAAPKFTRSMTCFISSAAALRQDRTRTEASITTRGTPATEREQRQLDRLQRDADNAEEKSAQSAYNGAQCYARIGQKNLALNLVDVAIAHPRMNEKAVAMKAAIEKLPNQ